VSRTAVGLGPRQVAAWRAALRRRSWREVLADAPALRVDGRYAAITDPRAAAILTVLDIPPAARCLVVGDRWGQLAVPLARRCRVTVLGQPAAALALLRALAEQEGVDVGLCAGTLREAPLAAAQFDLVLVRAGLGDEIDVRDAETLAAAARLLDPHGTLVLTAPGGDAACDASGAEPVRAAADAGLRAEAIYACFPDHEAPSYLVAQSLMAEQRHGWVPAGGPAGVTPGFVFVLRPAACA